MISCSSYISPVPSMSTCVIADFFFIKHCRKNLAPKFSTNLNFQSVTASKIIDFGAISPKNSRKKPFIGKVFAALESDNVESCHGGGDGSVSPPRDGKGSGGGRNDDSGDKREEAELGPLMAFDSVLKEAEGHGVKLPFDMLEAAKSIGIRRQLLLRYLDLQGSIWPVGFAVRHWPLFRNRMLADPSFLFKIGTEVVIDSCCATFAEIQKRGKNFWTEFELYAADLSVGIVVDIALVSMLAPYVRFGLPNTSSGFAGYFQQVSANLPSSVFEVGMPGCRFSAQQRLAAYLYKGVLYGSVGFACGLIGQGIANVIMNAKRSVNRNDDDIPVPPLFKSAALWGLFLAISSNTRYQIINGLEHMVEASSLAKRVPPVAMAFTVGVRFANNIYGGMQFVDLAKLSGVQ